MPFSLKYLVCIIGVTFIVAVHKGKAPEPISQLLFKQSCEEHECCPQLKPDKCTYVRETPACSSFTQLFNYPELYFCVLPERTTLITVVLFGWIAFMFLLLGVAADRFFCRALEVIADFWQIPPNVAGATLLAFGNGAPDLFTQLAAGKPGNEGASGIVVSEPLGGGMFTSTIALSAVTFLSSVSPRAVPVEMGPLYRDCVAYMVALVVVGILVYDGQITLVEALSLLLLYGAYMTYVLCVSRNSYEPLHIEQAQRLHLQSLDSPSTCTPITPHRRTFADYADIIDDYQLHQRLLHAGSPTPSDHDHASAELGRKSLATHNQRARPRHDTDDVATSTTYDSPGVHVAPSLRQYLSSHSSPIGVPSSTEQSPQLGPAGAQLSEHAELTREISAADGFAFKPRQRGGGGGSGEGPSQGVGGEKGYAGSCSSSVRTSLSDMARSSSYNRGSQDSGGGQRRVRIGGSGNEAGRVPELDLSLLGRGGGAHKRSVSGQGQSVQDGSHTSQQDSDLRYTFRFHTPSDTDEYRQERIAGLAEQHGLGASGVQQQVDEVNQSNWGYFLSRLRSGVLNSGKGHETSGWGTRDAPGPIIQAQTQQDRHQTQQQNHIAQQDTTQTKGPSQVSDRGVRGIYVAPSNAADDNANDAVDSELANGGADGLMGGNGLGGSRYNSDQVLGEQAPSLQVNVDQPERTAKQVLGQILMQPVLFLLRLTMPDVGLGTVTYPKQYAIVLPITSPLFLLLSTGLYQYYTYSLGGVVLTACCCAIGCSLVYGTYPVDGKHYGALSGVFTVLTFIMSIMWMNMAAGECVRVMQTFSIVYQLNPVLLGASVLAWGNCAGDLVADIAMAKDGFPSMAITACFASPFFTLTAGVGVVMSYHAYQTGKPQLIADDGPLQFAILAGLVNTLRILVTLSTVHKKKLTTSFAITGILTYVLFNTFYCLFSLGKVSWPLPTHPPASTNSIPQAIRSLVFNQPEAT